MRKVIVLVCFLSMLATPITTLAEVPTTSADVQCTIMKETGINGHILRCIDKKYNLICWWFRFNSANSVDCFPMSELDEERIWGSGKGKDLRERDHEYFKELRPEKLD